LAHMFMGIVKMSSGRTVQGIAECEHALALNGNLADAHASLGGAKLFIGRAAETEAHIMDALRLSPRDEAAPRWMSYLGLAKLHLADDAKATEWLHRSLQANPNYPLANFLLAAALALLGKLDEARTAADAGLALDPTFTIRRLKAFPRNSNSDYRAGTRRMIEGMRLAGLPEE
jgi:tetratricopeptide (TPR) repeat protein